MEAAAEGAEVGRVRRRRDGDEEEEEEEEAEAEDGVDDEVSLVSVREENIGFLKNLNTVLFPINYQNRYYAHVLSSGDFSKLGKPRFLLFFILLSCHISVCLFVFLFFFLAFSKSFFLMFLGFSPYF